MGLGRQVLDHRGHAQGVDPVKGQDLPDRIVAAEVLAGDGAGDDHGVGRGHGVAEVARHGRQGQDVEEAGIDPGDVLTRLDGALPDAGLGVGQPRHRQPGELQLQPGGDLGGRIVHGDGGLVRHGQAGGDHIGLAVAGDEAVEAQLVADVERRQDHRRQPERQARHADRHVEPVPRQIAQGARQDVAEHGPYRS